MLFIVFPKTKIQHRKGETLWGVALFYWDFNRAAVILYRKNAICNFSMILHLKIGYIT